MGEEGAGGGVLEPIDVVHFEAAHGVELREVEPSVRPTAVEWVMNAQGWKHLPLCIEPTPRIYHLDWILYAAA